MIEWASSLRDAPSHLGVRGRVRTVCTAHQRRGLAGVAVTLAGRIPRRLLSVEWFSVFEVALPVAQIPSEWDVRRAHPEDAPLLARVGHVGVSEIRARFAGGDVAYVALERGVPVGYRWIRSGRWREGDIEFILSPDERWAYDLFVHPDHRGRGVGMAMAVQSLEDLHEQGVHRVLSVIDHLNASSLRSSRRWGAREIVSVLTVDMGGVHLVHERGVGDRRGRVSLRRDRTLVRRPPTSPPARRP